MTVCGNDRRVSYVTLALAENISAVNGAISETNRSADSVLAASGKVGIAADRLAEEVESFFLALRTGPMDRRTADNPNYRGPERRHDYPGNDAADKADKAA